MPKKNVRQLTEDELPEPFRSYWLSDDRSRRDWSFFDVDGELYIQDGEYPLLDHWTQSTCCGVAQYMMDEGIAVNQTAPVILADGTYLFEAFYSGGLRSIAAGRRDCQD